MNQNQRNWQPVGGGSNNTRWEPQKMLPFNPQNPYNFIQGYFTAWTERNAQNGPFMVATITTVKQDQTGNIIALDEEFDVSGGVGMENTMNNIPLYSFVGIKYAGKQSNPKNGRTFNQWEIFTDTSALPYNQVPGANVPKPAAPAPVPQPQWGQPTPGQSFPTNPPYPAQGFQQAPPAGYPPQAPPPFTPNPQPTFNPNAQAFTPAPPVPQKPFNMPPPQTAAPAQGFQGPNGPPSPAGAQAPPAPWPTQNPFPSSDPPF